MIGDGPDDQLARVTAERDEAVAIARQLEHELGELRGRVKRLDVMMWRRTARRRRVAAWARLLRSAVGR